MALKAAFTAKGTFGVRSCGFTLTNPAQYPIMAVETFQRIAQALAKTRQSERRKVWRKPHGCSNASISMHKIWKKSLPYKFIAADHASRSFENFATKTLSWLVGWPMWQKKVHAWWSKSCVSKNSCSRPQAGWLHVDGALLQDSPSCRTGHASLFDASPQKKSSVRPLLWVGRSVEDNQDNPLALRCDSKSCLMPSCMFKSPQPKKDTFKCARPFLGPNWATAESHSRKYWSTTWRRSSILPEVCGGTYKHDQTSLSWRCTQAVLAEWEMWGSHWHQFRITGLQNTTTVP